MAPTFTNCRPHPQISFPLGNGVIVSRDENRFVCPDALQAIIGFLGVAYDNLEKHLIRVIRTVGKAVQFDDRWVSSVSIPLLMQDQKAEGRGADATDGRDKAGDVLEVHSARPLNHSLAGAA